MTPPPIDNLEQAQRVIRELCATVTDLQAQNAWLNRQLFGRKSERWHEAQQPGLFNDDASAPPPEELPVSPAPDQSRDSASPSSRRSSVRGKRGPIPDDLPRVERIYDLPESEKVGMKRIGQAVSEQLEYEPGRVYVIRHVRYTYARLEERLSPDGDGQANVVTARRPDEGLPKCLAGPSLLAHLAVSKFADSLPLHRLEGILKRKGVKLARSSMCRWMQELAALSAPLLDMMKMHVLRSHVIQADETPVKQQDASGGRRGTTKTCYFYSYVGDDASGGGGGGYILYDYQPGRSRAGPNGWFSDARGEPNYHGLLQCDAYTGYDELFDANGPWRMRRIGCWAHARRRFYDVRDQFPGPCHHVLARIGALYEVEKQARDLDPEARRALRAEHSRPIVEALLTWCAQQQGQTLPKSGLGEALGYVLNQAGALRRYLDDGRLAIDNNLCERSLRGIAIGRRNWLFTGSLAGGRAAAAMFSLIASARRHDVEPLAYLTDLFTRLPATPISQLDQFLPDHWQSSPT